MTCKGIARVVLAVVVGAGALGTTARGADETDVVGTWTLKYEPGDGQTHEPVLTITKDKDGLKGEFVEGENKGMVKELRLKDGELRVKVESKYNDEPAVVTYTGKPDGDAWKGDAAWEYQGMSGSFSFEAKRQAAKKDRDDKAALGTWRLTIDATDGRHEPVLTIARDGDGLKGEYVEGDKPKRTAKSVTFEAGKLTVKVDDEHDGNPVHLVYEGKVKGDAMDGEVRWELGDMSGSFPFNGKREATKGKG